MEKLFPLLLTILVTIKSWLQGPCCPLFLVSVAAMGAATNARGTPRKRSADEKILHLKKKGRPGGN